MDGGVEAGRTDLEHAMGSSQEPGTDCTTMFDSLTPEARSLAFVPARRGSIIAAFLLMLPVVGMCGSRRVALTGVPASVDDADA